MAWLEIGRSGAAALSHHPWRSVATTACVVATLLPYLVGMGISAGLAQQAADSLRFGADLYVTGSRFGRRVPLPLNAVDKIAAIQGVRQASPRVVGAIRLGQDQHPAVVVGLATDRLPPVDQCLTGRLFDAGKPNELVVGSDLASRLKLKPGSVLPPFYHNRRGDRVSKVVGVFKPDAPLWQANTILTSHETAVAIFDQPEWTTEILVSCSAGEVENVARRILRQLEWVSPNDESRLGVQVSSRDELQVLWRSAAAHRDGIFHLHFILACSVAVLAVFVTSGFGSSERRREVGILKALGWQTDEVLLRSGAESVLLSLGGSALTVLTAWVWLRWFNGYGIAALFLPGLDARPAVQVPFQLLPVPVLLVSILSWVVVTCGSLYSTWRTSIVPPAEAMR